MSTTFKDRLGNPWNLEINLEDAFRIEEYDFQNKTPKVQMCPPTEDFLTHRLADPRVCFGLAWVITEPQRKSWNESLNSWNQGIQKKIEEVQKKLAQGQTQELQKELEELPSQFRTPIQNELDFAKLLDGRSIQELKQSLWEALVNFFPDHATTLRVLTNRFSEVIRRTDERLSGEATRRLSNEQIDKELDLALEKADREIERMRDQEMPLFPTPLTT